MAEESAGIQTLRVLAAGDHHLVKIFCSSGDTSSGASVASAAQQRGLQVEAGRRVKDRALARELRDDGIDLLLNVHSLYLIHEDVVEAPLIGSFNLHPGPLPAYAGLNAPSWAIFNGEARHGVTLHWMEAGIDTGAIAYQAGFDLSDEDTGLSASVGCVRNGMPLIKQLLEDAAAGTIPKIEQDLSKRHLYKRGQVPHDGVISWSLPAKEIDAFVRAADYYPFPSPWSHPRAEVGGKEVGIVKVARTSTACDQPPGAVRREGGTIAVATGDEWLTLRLLFVDGSYVKPDDAF